ncbi:MAG: hypothetical protein RBQ97_10060 [Acholeplasma sp.]|nr:hypothetical protein [Acholeplasma sp.]
MNENEFRLEENNLKYEIYKNLNSVSFHTKDNILSIFSTASNPFTDEINIHISFFHHKFDYAIINLSGKGLMSLRGLQKYIDDKIISPFLIFFREIMTNNLEFDHYQLSNEHLSKIYWEEITTKYAYNSNERMYIKISTSNLNNLFEKMPYLNEYYSTGIVKYIKGVHPKLEYINNDKRYSGIFKLNRNGYYNCNFSDVEHFNLLIIELIQKGFYD